MTARGSTDDSESGGGRDRTAIRAALGLRPQPEPSSPEEPGLDEVEDDVFTDVVHYHYD